MQFPKFLVVDVLRNLSVSFLFAHKNGIAKQYQSFSFSLTKNERALRNPYATSSNKFNLIPKQDVYMIEKRDF